jgi:hypothetical protein
VKHTVDIEERIPGRYWHAAAILKLELDSVVQRPLEELRYEIGGGAITRRVDAEIGPMATGPASLGVPLRWKAAAHPKLFPVMHADLHISDADGDHILLRVHGVYIAPLGPVGAVADALAGRRIAQKSVRRFLNEVSRRLADKLVEHAG